MFHSTSKDWGDSGFYSLISLQNPCQLLSVWLRADAVEALPDFNINTCCFVVAFGSLHTVVTVLVSPSYVVQIRAALPAD